MPEYIDSHVHLWKIERGDYEWLTPESGILYRDYEYEELEPLLDEHRVRGVVAVQAAPSLQETEYLLSLAEQYPRILGVVGWTDLAADYSESAIVWLAEQQLLSGIRLDARFAASYTGGAKQVLLNRLAYLISRGMVLDWLISPGVREVLLDVMKELPEMTAVVNHLAAPPFTAEGYAVWLSQMEQLSHYPNTFVKLSGMITQGDGQQQDRHIPYADAAIELFGSQRLLFGSDWPVALNGGSYGDTIRYMEQLLPNHWDDEARAAVRKGNAIRIYKLERQAE
ncbi:amidohydrolase family protein [Paenibacillus sp. GCM10023252]|uniref:amidohydrolase family protein n=1 Tax=Paenibacillus sp. GCM10023252 TaxID=3252649 RepID=UPI003623E6E8